MKKLLSLLFLFPLPLATVANDTASLIAKNYGIANWDKVESISYTFNVKLPNREVARAWTWYPKTDKVTSHADKLTYTRGEGMDERIDKNFINDVFWLLFPFQIVWDPSLRFEEEKDVKDPVDGETVNLLRVLYNREDGYTPGDVYELFYDKDYTITAWNFIRGGEGEGRPMSWEGNQSYNGITISTDHHAPGNGMRLWFTDIQTQLK